MRTGMDETYFCVPHYDCIALFNALKSRVWSMRRAQREDEESIRRIRVDPGFNEEERAEAIKMENENWMRHSMEETAARKLYDRLCEFMGYINEFE